MGFRSNVVMAALPVLLLAHAAAAQTTATDLPPAAEVIARFVKTTRMDLIRTHSSSRSTG
jgi:hypothetical protein